MAREGWVKLHRKLMEKAIWRESTPEQKTILITLLMMANHKETEWEWKGEKYTAGPGQFITSLDSIVKRCGKGVSKQNVRTAMKRFEKYEFLTDESTNKNRLITIVNWGDYQGGNDEPNTQTNMQLTPNQHATNMQLTPNKNVKNEKNVKNVKKEDNMSTSSKSTGDDYRSVYDHYLTKDNLTDHRTYTKAMTDSIKRAIKDLKITIEDCKLIIDRHSQIVEVTKDNGQYAVRKQNLDKLFGSTVHNGKTLKCAEYLDDGEKYLRYIKGGGNYQNDERSRKNGNRFEYEEHESGITFL